MCKKVGRGKIHSFELIKEYDKLHRVGGPCFCHSRFIETSTSKSSQKLLKKSICKFNLKCKLV